MSGTVPEIVKVYIKKQPETVDIYTHIAHKFFSIVINIDFKPCYYQEHFCRFCFNRLRYKAFILNIKHVIVAYFSHPKNASSDLQGCVLAVKVDGLVLCCMACG